MSNLPGSGLVVLQQAGRRERQGCYSLCARCPKEALGRYDFSYRGGMRGLFRCSGACSLGTLNRFLERRQRGGGEGEESSCGYASYD